MDDKATVERLVRLGLTTYAARAYISLVRRNSYTAAQIARPGRGEALCDRGSNTAVAGLLEEPAAAYGPEYEPHS